MFGEVAKFRALCDSGNLLRDPFDNSPVIIVKKRAVIKDIPRLGTVSGRDITRLSCLPDTELSRRIRPISISGVGGEEVMLGIRADSLTLTLDGKRQSIRATVIIDNKGGEFGGFMGLIGTAAVTDAFR